MKPLKKFILSTPFVVFHDIKHLEEPKKIKGISCDDILNGNETFLLNHTEVHTIENGLCILSNFKKL